ncbi:MAG: hypothetical protein ABJH96_17525 [Algoriphagus sp.]|uniref:hypothetical protein n=1 Tax=Algoriphagus sp. TaxID=1872435 RepID=UPI003296CFB1
MPYDSETLVSALSKEEVLGHLNRVTKEVNFLDQRTQANGNIIFNGLIGRRGFRISKVVNRADTFLPLVLGKIEGTPRGCIIFLSYRLFPGAMFFLAFWSIVLVAFTAMYALVIPNYSYATICFSLALANYLTAMYFFNRQVKTSRQIFHKLINFQMKD